MNRQQEEPQEKREYQPPRLSVYGDFRRVTKITTKGGTGQDGGAKPSTRATGPPG